MGRLLLFVVTDLINKTDESNKEHTKLDQIRICHCLVNAIKLIENALKEARRGVFRVRSCRSFEKMRMPSRRRGLRLKNYRLLSRGNVHRREAIFRVENVVVKNTK